MYQNERPATEKPNVVIILADDMGFSDIGCYGGFIETPNLDRLAKNGIRLTGFHNTARCSPSRASLLTGLHPHQAGMAHLQGRFGPYTRQLTANSVTIAEVLKENGYSTYMSGKWHAGVIPPHQRGFDKAYFYPGGHYFKHDNISLNGELLDPESFGEDYFSTDSMTGHAVGLLDKHMKETPDKPFLLYMAFTAPHFPLQAKESDIAKYKGRFDKGWDELRDIKFKRMQELGVIDPSWELSPKEASSAYSWEEEPHKEWRLRAMEVYAALIDNMDANIGRIISKLEEAGQLDNTMIIFLSDNGGNAEFPNIKDPEILPGDSDYMVGNGHYGHGWANLSNTPYRMYKHYIHEGGIASPFIVHWPKGLTDKGVIRGGAVQLPDIMATIVDITGAKYPQQYNGNDIMPMEGVSMLPLFQGSSLEKECLYWEHEGNCGVRKGKWKLVRFYDKPWELYDMEVDGTETNDLSAQHPELVSELNGLYSAWTKRTNVLPYDEYMKYAVKKDKGQRRKQREQSGKE